MKTRSRRGEGEEGPEKETSKETGPGKKKTEKKGGKSKADNSVEPEWVGRKRDR